LAGLSSQDQLFIGMLILGGLTMAQDNSALPVRNVVLVHDAFADGPSWSKVVQLPETTKLMSLL
jgi:hypothetical protein